MPNYTIHYREADEKVKVVEIGWNSDAMKFGLFWALSNKLWGHFLVSILFLVGAALASLYFGQIGIFFIAWMLIHIELALHGNEQYLSPTLYKDSYIEYTEIKANTPDEAESIFRKEQAELKREVEESIAEDKRYEEQIKRDEEEWEKYQENEEKKEESKRTKNSKEQDTFGSSPVNQNKENAIERLINKEITVSQYEDIKKKKDEELKGQADVAYTKAMDEKAKKLPDDDNDDEFYLIATKEVEGSDRNEALWAKCMATQMGDDTKAKYCYVNKRVESLKQEAKDKAEYRIMLEAKIRLEVYLSIERNISSASDNPENDLASDNLFPNSPNDHYRKKITSQFEEKVKERLEKEINLNDY